MAEAELAKVLAHTGGKFKRQNRRGYLSPFKPL